MKNKQEIVRIFFNRGKLLTAEALDFLENAGQIPEKEYGGLILTEKDFQEKEKDTVRILKHLEKKPAETTTEDFVKFYTAKYEKMKSVILSRIQKDFVSLNKLDSTRSEVYVLGIVKDIKNSEKKIVELEDLTGSAPVIFDDIEGLELDDVVAIRAVSAGKVLYGKEVIYPDIPLRKPATGFGKACFISDLRLDESPKRDAEKFFGWFENQDIKYLFIAGDICGKKALEDLINRYCYGKKIFVTPGEKDSDNEYPNLAETMQNKNAIPLSNPAMVEVNGVKILMIHRFSVDMLKKRYLGKSKLIIPDDYLVLEEVPDIVHCGHTQEPHVMNYKSVTIVNSGSPLKEFKPVVVDFETREVVQVKL